MKTIKTILIIASIVFIILISCPLFVLLLRYGAWVVDLIGGY